MRSSKAPYLFLLLLLTICFSLAARLQPQMEMLRQNQSTDLTAVLLGDSRRIFANHFFVKADAYFHSGFYPTIYDNQESFKTAHMAEDAGALKGKNQGDETAFMGKPHDFIEAFERNFMPSRHTHLDEGGAMGTNQTAGDLGEEKGGDVREILPWLKLSAELDPNRIETYAVTAYWLRSRMGKVNEAEDFLRQGLRANPRNPALLFELGRIYHEDRKDTARARNVWEVAASKLEEQKTPRTEQDDFMLFQVSLNLARLEEAETNLSAALDWLEKTKPLSPEPETVQKQIEDLKLKISKQKLTVPANEPAIQSK
jgi:tetratricopeptide (TPR) repeat protein